MRVPVVGQTVYALNVGNNARNRPQKLTPCTVSSVGRKYFRCKVGISFVETEFRLDTWLEHTDYCAGLKAYESEQEWNDEREKAEITAFLREVFQYGNNTIPLESLREIRSILSTCTPPVDNQKNNQ